MTDRCHLLELAFCPLGSGYRPPTEPDEPYREYRQATAPVAA